jgi:hypothetical protein
MKCIKSFMARKMNSMKFAQETRDNAAIMYRQPGLPVAAFYLMQMRSQALRISPPRRRLQVFADAETRAQTEHPVKIIHAA